MTRSSKSTDAPVAPGAAGRAGPALSLPADALILLPVRSMVLFPGLTAPIGICRPSSIAAVQQAVREERPIGVVLQRNAEVDDPGTDDLHRVGTIANIVRYMMAPDGSHHILCRGVQRIRILEDLPGTAFPVARVLTIPEPRALSPEVEARFPHLHRQAVEAIQLLPQAPVELVVAVRATTSPAALIDLTTAYMDILPEEKQEILETLDLGIRMDKVSRLLAQRIEVLRHTEEIGRQTRSALDERQHEAAVRGQLATPQRQLGEGDGKAQEIAELNEAIARADMPAEAKEQARYELRRYERMPDAAAESGLIRTYLHWLLDLPWALPEEKTIDIAEARRVLDEDHFGLEKVKQRIIEHLAVRKLAPRGKAPILCFVGPPCVGKTTLAQSIARVLGRPFVRVGLGGVHDEAEIRGHRRTFVGAHPGSIIHAIHKAKARNCVMVLDDIDKMGRGNQGDPSAALLEVLDPEQNNSFRDNYLGVPFDLSRVVFIATANRLDTVPGPLRDRMEITGLAGYTEDEKLEIARRYLVRHQLEANGLTGEQAEIEEGALRTIIRAYTREAGVRNLEREIARALRHAAVWVAEGSTERVRIDVEDLAAVLGPPRFENEVAMRTSVAGVATGLAWTPVGGEIMFIEATHAPGRGTLILTGQLGDVMRESAQAALSLVKNRAASLGIDPSIFEKSEIHMHVPAGATPKDGPSAGIAIFIAVVSLLTGRKVRSETGMTGEVSLRGLVLPVGGIKEKVVAAAAAGLTRVMLPARNRRDFEDIPKDAREHLEFIWIEQVDDAISAALQENPVEVQAAAE